MHDLIHDLALRVAGIHCRFIAQNYAAVNISERLNHVSFINPPQHVLLRQLLQARGLRTYILIEDLWASDKYGAMIFLLSIFKRMRVLDLRRCDFKELPNWVCKMQHLRYLNLHWNDRMKVIPNSITNLVNLQMLNLSSCRNLRELPEGIGKLISLRHLDIDECNKISQMPRGLEKLTSLRTLSRFIVGGDERTCIGIGALKGLNNLSGRLSIEKLEKVGDARLESKSANLMGKQYLRHLILQWKDKDDDAEILLDGLQPHPNLRVLEIDGYCGVRLPSWMMGNMGISLPNIVDISLKNCPSIRQLPPFHQLPCLKSLALQNLPKVEEYGCDGDGSSSSSFPCLTYLRIFKCPMLTSMPLAPLLEELDLFSVSDKLVCQQLSSSPLSRLNALVKIELNHCPSIRQLPPFHQLPCLKYFDLRNLPKVEEYGCDGDGSSSLSSSSSFPCLTYLRVFKCPMLTSMPLAPLLEKLDLHYVSEKLVCQQLSSSTLSRLSSLSIWEIEDLEALPEGGVLRNLTSLKTLSIRSCPRLVRLAEIQHLSALENLDIFNCEEVDLSDDGMNWQALSNLYWLMIQKLPKLVSLLEGLQHVTTLQSIHITDCPGLVALPEWMSNLTSLKYLRIMGRCPLLWERCEKDTGEDWPNIAHIPRISMNRESVWFSSSSDFDCQFPELLLIYSKIDDAKKEQCTFVSDSA